MWVTPVNKIGSYPQETTNQHLSTNNHKQTKRPQAIYNPTQQSVKPGEREFIHRLIPPK